MLLLQRGGGYNAQQKAKMPSSLPFYTLTIFVLMSQGSEKGVGWPTLCKALQGHFSWRQSQEHPTKSGWMKGCIGHSSVGPSLCPMHTPRPLLLQGGVSRPLHQDPALCMSLSHWGQPWECREAAPIPAGIRNLRPNGTPSGWRPF